MNAPRTLATQHFILTTINGEAPEVSTVYASSLEEAVAETQKSFDDMRDFGYTGTVEVRPVTGDELPWNACHCIVAEGNDLFSITRFPKNRTLASVLAETALFFEGCNIRQATPEEAELYCRTDALSYDEESAIEFERGFNEADTMRELYL
jgi:hypothetical protein